MKLYGNVYTHTYVAIFYTLNVAKVLYPVYQPLMWQMFFISCTSTPYVIPPCGVFKEIKYDDDDDVEHVHRHCAARADARSSRITYRPS